MTNICMYDRYDGKSERQQMIGRRRKGTKLIDIEWAKLLKGLSVKVPDNWWTSCSGQILHDGKIDSFDQSTQKWNLLLDSNDNDDLHLLAYDALCEYFNK